MLADVEDMPFLEGFYTQPKLKNVTPTFDMAVLEYYATVPYDVLLVMVWAFTRNCYSEARLHTKYGVSRSVLLQLLHLLFVCGAW